MSEPIYLYLDTETSDYHEASSPALPVEVAAILEQGDRILSVLSAIIHQGGWQTGTWNAIAQRVIDIHGIDAAMSREQGVHPDVMLNMFRHMVMRASVVVGHNITFDVSVMDHAYRSQHLPPPDWPALFCTMKESATIVQMPPRGRYSIGGFKPPKLSEAYHFFSGKELPRAHTALADNYAARLIHRAILRRAAEAVSGARQENSGV